MTMFATQRQARQFFVYKIVQQGEADGTPLTADERLMLEWSEVEPDSVADPELAERLAAEISDADYEEKIAGLLERSYAADVSRDAGVKATWVEARRTLKQAITTF